MNLIILPKSSELLDTAFRRARKKAGMLKSQRNRIKDAKSRNITKVEVSCNYIAKTLQKAVEEFPSIKQMHPFYRELVEAMVDINATLKALGHMTAERKIMAKLRAGAIGRIKGLNKKEARKAAVIAREFYGRLSSLTKKLDKSIEKYNLAAKKMRELPSIKFDLPTAIIAGYPNTGKSTILSRLTQSKPKIASYPFTTQRLQIGYLIHNYLRVQLIDTPGLLDRPIAKKNRIERKAIAALRHLANALIFVVDPTTVCGFPLQKQASLLKEIKKELASVPTIVAINKADIASKEEMQAAKEKFGQEAAEEGKGIESRLGEKIASLFQKKRLK